MPETKEKFPYENSKDRLHRYSKYMKILKGQHYEAFAHQSGKEFTERYKALRYVVCNYGGLLSKVGADFLVGEPIQIKSNSNQAWLDLLMFHNKFHVKTYESALQNTARGDAVYRIRIENGEMKLESISPSMYFAKFKGDSATEPYKEELAWTKKFGEGKDAEEYLIREIHTAGKVETKVNMLNKGEIGAEVDLDSFNRMARTNYIPEINTKLNRSLLFHVANYRNDNTFYGVSDYEDLESLMFALNNRMTKIDNTLDKHNDPILAVPEGVLDENGQVKKEALQLFEVSEDGQKPEYIVWNASLDNAFKQIDKLMEFLFMFSEINPDVLGMGQGMAESGRALKLRMLRTVAKRNRKRIYYEQGIKELLYTAQRFAKLNGYKVDGQSAKDDAQIPDVIWQDGIVNDEREIIENETLKLESGLTTKERAIMAVNSVDEIEAKLLKSEIDSESPSIEMPFNLAENDSPEPIMQ